MPKYIFTYGIFDGDEQTLIKKDVCIFNAETKEQALEFFENVKFALIKAFSWEINVQILKTKVDAISPPPTMTKIGNPDNVGDYFNGIMIPVEDIGGKYSVPGWECQKCGWSIGSIGLPPSHICPDEGIVQEEKRKMITGK